MYEEFVIAVGIVQVIILIFMVQIMRKISKFLDLISGMTYEQLEMIKEIRTMKVMQMNGKKGRGRPKMEMPIRSDNRPSPKVKPHPHQWIPNENGDWVCKVKDCNEIFNG